MDKINFEINEPITIQKIFDSNPCTGKSFLDAISFILRQSEFGFASELPKDLLQKAFEKNDEWFYYALEEGWISEIHDEISCQNLHRDKKTGDLYDLTYDLEREIIIVININENHYEIIEVPDIHIPNDYDDIYLECLNEHMNLELEDMGVELKDVILKKVLNK
ncbi:MAG: hypothetical protein PVG65_05295 [Candidatus Thorarchaeota archaeon]|jgi:hypothetical protein